ncbi:hypothetical protein BC827DRAFT_1152730 [Russula dissimulans]|nr:hypothetical protein BC827DRAFT_1152730 [Russula dissimulans]
MKTRSENPYLFPDTFYTNSLDAWTSAIQRLPRALEAKQCDLDQVVHYKALSGMEHEFLVVYASHRPSGSKIVLGVDRNAEELPQAASSESQQESLHTTGTPSSSLGSSARCVSTLMHVGSSFPPPESPPPRPLPMAIRNRLRALQRTVALSTLTFSSLSYPTSPTAASDSSGSYTRRRPTLLHLSVLLRTIRVHFPDYALLQYQCYFFARATCLALIDLFGGVEKELEEGQRAATWRGMHVSLYSAGHAAFQNMLLLPLIEFPTLIVPAGLFAVYSAVRLYDGNVVESEVDRRRISDEKIRELAIPHKYSVAWRLFVLEGRQVIK